MPRKPIDRRLVMYLVVAVLVIGVLLSSTVSYLSTSQTAAQPGEEPPSTATKPQVTQFDHDLKQAGDNIRKNIKNAQKVATLAEALHAQLPPCDAQIRTQLHGRYYVLKSNVADQSDVNAICQEDGQWAILPPNFNSVHETPEQQATERTAGSNGGMSPAEKRKLRRELAFRSNPIPLHFADADAGATVPSLPVPDTAAPVVQSEALSATAETTAASPRVSQPMQSGGSLSAAPAPGAPTGTSSLPSEAYPSKVQEAVPLGVQLSGSVGEKYPIYEGRTIEGLLANRLMGQQGGVVKVQITTPVYSWNAQHLLIPPGALLLGESTRVSVGGQTRLAVVFHRVIMPDGYSFLFASKVKGVDQQGASGLTGKVNSHLASLIGTAVMVGAIAGLADFTNVGSGSAVVEIQGGVSREGSTEAMQIMRNALNRPPDVTVYEGTRVRVFVAEDQALPEYQNHVVTAAVQ